jgi:hypothetical protein
MNELFLASTILLVLTSFLIGVQKIGILARISISRSQRRNKD